MSMIIIKSNQINSSMFILQHPPIEFRERESGSPAGTCPCAKSSSFIRKVHFWFPKCVKHWWQSVSLFWIVSFVSFDRSTRVKFMAICFSCVKSALFNSLMEVVMSTDNFHFFVLFIVSLLHAPRSAAKVDEIWPKPVTHQSRISLTTKAVGWKIDLEESNGCSLALCFALWLTVHIFG